MTKLENDMCRIVNDDDGIKVVEEVESLTGRRSDFIIDACVLVQLALDMMHSGFFPIVKKKTE